MPDQNEVGINGAKAISAQHVTGNRWEQVGLQLLNWIVAVVFILYFYQMAKRIILTLLDYQFILKVLSMNLEYSKLSVTQTLEFIEIKYIY